MPLGLYPTFVKADPGFALELLAQMRRRCLSGDPLDDEERKFLADAIGKIIAGLDANKAFHLVSNTGRKQTLFDRRSRDIYNEVEALKGKGMSQRKAYKTVAAKIERGADTTMSEKGIEAIHRRHVKAMRGA